MSGSYLETHVKNDCTGCGACAYICSTQAIQIRSDEEGFLFPHINNNLCVACNRCTMVCPQYNDNSLILKSMPKRVIGFQHADRDVLARSASGGAFWAIVSHFEHKGHICGASMCEDNHVRHVLCDSLQAAQSLHGSKYVQSDMIGIYEKISELIGRGENVCFFGTPCQVAGIKSAFLSEHLTTVDLLCGGVCSPKFLQDYLTHMQATHNSRVVSVLFRSKKNHDWEHGRFTIRFANNSKYKKPSFDRSDPYMKAFLENFSIRNSCFSCPFYAKERVGDITIGDFWGVYRLLPYRKYKEGVSLILANTEKGVKIVERISNSDGMLLNLELARDVFPYNAFYLPKRNESIRNEFMQEYVTNGMANVITKWLKPYPILRCIRISVNSRIKYRLRTLLKR